MGTKLAFALGLVLAAAPGFLAGRHSAPADRGRAADGLQRQLAELEAITARLGAGPPPGCPALPPSGAPALDAPGLRAEVTRIVREALHAELAAGRTAAPAVPGRPPPSPDAVAAARQAHLLVDQALAQRRWTEREVKELRQLATRWSDEQRDEVLHKLLPAINRGYFLVETQGPPF